MGKKQKLAFLDLLVEASKGGTVLSDFDIREEVTMIVVVVVVVSSKVVVVNRS